MNSIEVSLRNSYGLTQSAKFLVEALIEGEITETEVSKAQEALEGGDRDADREILARLTTKCYAADAPPLFLNSDSLYETLDQNIAVKEEL